MPTANNNRIQILAPKSTLYFYIGFCSVMVLAFIGLTVLAFFEYGLGMSAFLGVITLILIVVSFKLSHLHPIALNLYDTYLTCEFFKSKVFSRVLYSDIDSFSFEDFSTGRGNVRNYYLVARCKTGTVCKIPLKGLTRIGAEQERIIAFVLSRNPDINFSFRLNAYGEWESA